MQPQHCSTSTTEAGHICSPPLYLPAFHQVPPIDRVHTHISTNPISPGKNEHEFLSRIPVPRIGKTKYLGAKGKFFSPRGLFYMEPNKMRIWPKSSYKLEVLLWGLWVEIQKIIEANSFSFILTSDRSEYNT